MRVAAHQLAHERRVPLAGHVVPQAVAVLQVQSEAVLTVDRRATVSPHLVAGIIFILAHAHPIWRDVVVPAAKRRNRSAFPFSGTDADFRSGKALGNGIRLLRAAVGDFTWNSELPVAPSAVVPGLAKTRRFARPAATVT